MDRVLENAKAQPNFGELFHGVFDWIVPGQSVVSYVPLAKGALLSPQEFSKIGFLQPPWCACCAFPFEHDEGANVLCAACVARQPLFGRARAPLIYSENVSQMILSFKRQGRRSGLNFFANLMYDAGKDLVDTADFLLPVPLHTRRLISRGFNQAGWLASALSKRSGAPVEYDLLRRVKASRSQGQLSALQRRANVAGAFDLTQIAARKLNGKRILLVDDVFTTGATLEACIRTLKKAKPANVDVITLARVVAPKKQAI